MKGFVFGVATTLIILLLAAGAYFMGVKSGKGPKQAMTTSQAEITPTPTPQPTIAIEESEIPEGWLTYENEEYGFEISFPANYKALDDAENLYGWPNAVALVYGGGQSYDLPIEVWDSVTEYENKYPDAENLVVKEVGDKYITLLNMNLEEEVDTIIDTFKTP